jgi:hypothetical protein
MVMGYPEKLEECPRCRCADKKLFFYDFQVCRECGWGQDFEPDGHVYEMKFHPGSLEAAVSKMVTKKLKERSYAIAKV